MFTKTVLASMILQLGLAITAISILFFTVVKDIEGEIVLHEVDTIVRAIERDARLVDFKNVIRPTIVEKMQQVKQKPMDMTLDQQVTERNEKIVKKATRIVLIMLFLTLAICGAMKVSYKLPGREILIPAVAGVVVIVLTELFFLFICATRYITVDSNDIKRSLFNAIQVKYSTIDNQAEILKTLKDKYNIDLKGLDKLDPKDMNAVFDILSQIYSKSSKSSS